MSPVRNIDELLDGIVTLPSLPGSIQRVTQLVNDPHCSLLEVGKAISADPSLALKTLRLVNSAYYGLRNRVVSVEHAVSLLGMKVVKNLVLTALVCDTIKDGADQLLRHCVSCGVAMRILVERRGALPIEGDEAFVYGLLHDIGKVILEEYLAQEFQAAARHSKANCLPMHAVEREFIGADHAEMGQRLALKWSLPALLIETIGAHHDLTRTREPEARQLASVLAVADLVCIASGLSAWPYASVRVQDDVWKHCALAPENVPELIEQFFASLPFIDELIQIVK